jgi:hypothetical protein
VTPRVRRRGRKTPFSFVAFPHRVLRRVRAGEIDAWDLAILSALYARGQWYDWTAYISLEQLRGDIAWRWTDDALSKRLRRLKAKGELKFVSTPGQHGHLYEIRLLYDGPVSEQGPSTHANASPSTNYAEPSERSALADRTEPADSEEALPDDMTFRPRIRDERPSKVSSESPPRMGESPAGPAPPVRAPETKEEQPHRIEEQSTTDLLQQKRSGYEKVRDELTAKHPELFGAGAQSSDETGGDDLRLFDEADG